MRARHVRGALRTAGLAIALSSCVDPTQIVVVVDTDMAVPRELDAFRARVIGPEDDVALDEEYPLEPGDSGPPVSLAASFGVRPRGGRADRRVTVEVEALLDGEVLFGTKAITSYVEHRRLRLDMFLAARCIAERCADGQTCRRGGCEDERIDPDDLPDWGDAVPRQDVPDAAAPDTGIAACERVDLDSQGGEPRRIAVDRGKAYVANCACTEPAATGLWIVDVADPPAARLSEFVPLQNALDVAVFGDLVFVAEDQPRLYVHEVVDGEPQGGAFSEVWISGSSFAKAVAGVQDRAVVASTDMLLTVVDVSQPLASFARSTLTSGTDVSTDIAVLGEVVYVVDRVDGVEVVDFSAPDSPSVVGVVPTDLPPDSIDIVGGLALVGQELGPLLVLTLSNPTIPERVSEIDLPGESGQITTWVQSAIAARGTAGVVVIDLADPRNPTAGAPYDTGAPAYGVAVDGGWIYVADRDGLRVLSPACLGL